MYDELVKRLRDAAKMSDALAVLLPHSEGNAMAKLDNEAADAIEELQADKTALNGTVTNLLEQIKDLGKPRWISVSEMLPDGRDSVLALTGDCDFYVCDYIPSVKQFWTIPGDELHIDDITHWMLLPKVPEENA